MTIHNACLLMSVAASPANCRDGMEEMMVYDTYGQAKWETLVYEIPPELMMPRKKAPEIGFGGGDSQVWVARIRVVP